MQIPTELLMYSFFLLLLAVMAFMYASVGHGGASGYLTVLALFGAAPMLMKPSALILNIFVSLISFTQYHRGGHFRWKLFLPFAITSIPASYLGATLVIEEHLYKKVLALCLLFPIGKLLGLWGQEQYEKKDFNMYYGSLIGAVIGLLSGMIGIGGGIILSPVILWFRWANIKETAAVSALFILVNSVAGLAALLAKGYLPQSEIFVWLGIAVMGGTAGAYLGSHKFNYKILRYMLAVVLVIACVKLLIT
ncbi:MAG TPA: sulfite exporter TauE/SafE family protein [Cytophagales bacterium]|nr:sulfite exporter TauE/SafE family protein [Cytophagales bacterium]